MSILANQIQGRFTSDGENKLISVPSGVDRFWTWNATQADAAAPTASTMHYWQKGMAEKEGIVFLKNGSAVLEMAYSSALAPGFTEVNTADQTLGARIAVSAVSNATNFVVSTLNTDGMTTTDGSIVRLSDIATTFNTRGFDFEVGTVVANTSFTNRWALANAPGGAGGAGYWRRVYYDPIFYPRVRNIVSMSAAAQAVVVTSVPHGYKVGQTVRFHIPAGWGMTEMNNQTATVVAVSTANNSFTIDYNTSGFNAFSWIASTQSFDWATVAPSNMNTAEALDAAVDPYNDARENQAVSGILLYAGDFGPAGNANDVIYWMASTSSSVDNE